MDEHEHELISMDNTDVFTDYKPQLDIRGPIYKTS